jgi:heptosyltransferase-3
MPDEPFAVIHFATRWPSKAWPVARWRELIQGLLDFTPRLVLSCGPEPADVRIADDLCEQAGSRVSSTRGGTSWSQLAGILGKACYFVGVDTAAMHLAAAVQCPVVCLFGPSADFEFHPWSARYWMIRPHDCVDPAAMEQTPKEELMTLIPTAPVLAACREASAFGKLRNQDE